MTDLSKTIAPKSDQLNADDFVAGARTVVITGVYGNDGKDQPISISFEGDNGKPYKPCKSMRRVLVASWGADGSEYVGRSVTLYCDPKVKFGGIEVGGIRISHLSHIESDITMALTTAKARRSPYRIQRLEVARKQPPEPTQEQVETAKTQARAAASNGSDAFNTWWNSPEGKASRELVRDIMGELKATVATKVAENDG